MVETADLTRARPTGSPTLAILRLALLAIIVLVVFSGAEKITDLQAFEHVLIGHGHSPRLALALSWLAPLMEVAFGACSLYLLAMRRDALACSALAVFFMLLAAYAAFLVLWPPPKAASCGCVFSSRNPVQSWLPICLRNAALAACLALCGSASARAWLARR